MSLRALSYNGGVNTATSIGTLPFNQLLSAESVLLSGASLINRGGAFNLLGNSSSPVTSITSIFYWIDPSGNEWFIFGANDGGGDGQIFQMQNDGGTQTPTPITTTGVVNPFARYAVLNGIVCIAAQVLPLQWAGSGNVSALGATWTALNIPMIDCRTVNNFMFFAPYSSTVYWSNIGDPTTFSPGNSLPFRLGDGESILGLSNIGNNLVIFKAHSTGLLSTQTNIISGVVALGPLTTVSESVGCLCPTASDHLPDGRIILMGGDGHAYIFDGNIFTDISNQEYPNSNIQSKFDALANQGRLVPGIGFITVRVYPIRHETWFSVSDSAGTDIFIYDYLNNVWFEKPSVGVTHYIESMAQAFSVRAGGFAAVTGTLSGIYQRYQAIITGDAAGGLWLQDCGILSDESGSFPTCQIEFSVPTQSDERPNISRFFVVPFQTGTSGKTITYYVGKDGVYGSSKTFTSTGGWDRLKIALVSSDPITSQQIKITYQSSASIQFDPAYISDEGDQ